MFKALLLSFDHSFSKSLMVQRCSENLESGQKKTHSEKMKKQTWTPNISAGIRFRALMCHRPLNISSSSVMMMMMKMLVVEMVKVLSSPRL